MFRAQHLLVTWIGAVLLLTPGCNIENKHETEQRRQEDSRNPGTGLSMVYAEGWDAILIQANFAKTTTDNTGHWVTTRNACGMDEYGALQIDTWNRLAMAMNAALSQPPLAEPACRAAPEITPFKMDGTVEIALMEGGKKTVFESKGYEICSSVADPQISEELLKRINEIVIIADQANCPNGWGS